MSENKPKASRRGFFVGAAAVGAAAAAVTALPKVTGSATDEAAPAKPAPTRGGGYSLSEHVKQYYKTTLI